MSIHAAATVKILLLRKPNCTMILAWSRIPEVPDGQETVASRVEVCELVQRLFPRVHVTLDRVTFVKHGDGWQVNLHGYGPMGRLTP